jgi:hypothetical protein
MKRPSPLLICACDQLVDRINVETGLTHSTDLATAKELFVRLRDAGESVGFEEVYNVAIDLEFQDKDAQQLARLASEISQGKNVRYPGGPYWKEDIIDQLRGMAERAE